jgi:hypothetical protein
MAEVREAQPTAEVSPFVVISRQDWAELGATTEQPLTAEEIKQIQGLGDVLDLQEVIDVYLPLSRLLNLYVAETQSLHERESQFLGERAKRVPFIIGVAGSVAIERAFESVGRHAQGSPGYDRWLPIPKRRTRAPRHHGSQGFSRELRPQGTVEIRE